MSLYIYVLITFFAFSLLWLIPKKLARYFIMVVATIVATQYLAHWIDSFNIFYKMDTMTIFVIIWQFIALNSQWAFNDLTSPILLIEQASFCICEGIEASMLYDMSFRYLPIEISLALLWLLSLIDM